MVLRACKLPKNNSFFLFGARGTGKSTLIKEQLSEFKPIWIDLLRDDLVEKYTLRPQSLREEFEALNPSTRPKWIVIDEVQKVPKLLNVVHQMIEADYKALFALTGSSSRRLKQKGVNLLAGRAWLEYLFPLTSLELGKDFDLNLALQWGGLPKLLELNSEADKTSFLQAYALSYVKNEVQEEQWVRNLEPFRKFLPIAAQMNGKPLNYSAIEKDVGVSVPTIKHYYEILEDTLLGFHLPSFDRSVRKQQRRAAKFFFFDTGVKRALDRTVTLKLAPQTYDFGYCFEHWLICEFQRFNAYLKKDFEFSYLLTKDDCEIDLIVDRPGRPLALVEIKSTSRVDDKTVNSLRELGNAIPNSECFVLSLDTTPRLINKTKVLPWQQGLKEIFEV